MVAMFTCISTLVVLLGSCAVYCRLKKGTKQDEERSQHALLHELASPTAVAVTREGELVISEELPFIDLATIRSATDEFSDSNKLGQGGFGTVYKGTLPDGKEVAVKRLSRKSWQGLEEFKNEIILITKLQHRNLVKLLGCGIEGEEKVLIYEYMPNRSLDIFIFDSKRSLQLDWETCYNIIGGIARGLLYLHEDSRLKIVHRDLKPSNILLDHDMIAKISDFGMARIFCENQNIANTRRVVGTYGYMAPEYAMEGLFSVKSDVFSFGVILLEIISRKRNNRFYLTQHASTLLAYAWRLWNEGKDLEIVDPLLMESCQTSEVQRCIQIGLLCVQEDPTDRPTMSIVVALLGSESMELSPPRQPALSVGNVVPSGLSSTAPSVNELTVSIISPQ
ncbi:cysteine-rich receptor-like protein kinase 10 isoform X1 [Quercus robur]|uniref:cysteine-rich receptor-like protein kinase 10 isoform X1 n=1 Tax=Quercus robur TaxID=38942 RepID=UPI002161E1A0|nr:cysteine-rich receptor-like protein kinase 10 isoform X1 [Quercus robur]